MNRKITRLITLCIFLLMGSSASGQLTGTKNIPGDYASLDLAIIDLNTQGVGAGGVTLNLLAGNAQTAPAGGYAVTTLTGTAANQIIIQGNGNTISASAAQVAGSVTDAIFKIIGSDYVTISGFTMQENVANITTAIATNNMTEFGVALFYTSPTDGATNNKIQNNTITLASSYPNTFGVYSNSATTAANVAGAATSTAGTNSNNKVYSNIISGAAFGAVFIAPPAASTVAESGNDVGGASLATANTITFGNNTAPTATYTNLLAATSAGIETRNNIDVNISYNTVNSIAGLTIASSAINVTHSTTPVGVTFTETTNNNTITITNTGVTSIIGIDNASGLSTGTLLANNNNITITQTSSAANSATPIVAIRASYVSAAKTVSGNTIVINQNQSAGALSGGTVGITTAAAGTILTASNNNITINQTGSGTGTITGAITCLSVAGTATTNNVLGNTILVNQTTAVATGISTPITGILATAAATTLNITTNNAITIKQGVTGVGTYGGGAINYVDVAATHGTSNVVGNTFNTTGSSIRSTGALQCITVGSSQMGTLDNRKQNTATIDRIATSGSVAFSFTSGTPSEPNDTISQNTITFTGLAGTTTCNGITASGGASATGTSKNINNNVISISGTNTGAIVGILNNFSYGNCRNNTITVNTNSTSITGINMSTSTGIFELSNNSLTLNTGSTGTATLIGITGLNTTAGIYTVFNNTLNLNSTGGGAAVPGITGINISGGTNGTLFSSVYNNTFTNLTSSGAAATGANTITGIAVTSGFRNDVYSNFITNISTSASTGASTIAGVAISGGTTNNLFKNKIASIGTAATSTASLVSGIRISAGTTANVYNNLIGILTAPATSSADAIRAINLTSTTATANINVVYNTVYLNATSSGANFGTSGIYHTASATATTAKLVLGNNVIVNNSTAAGTGFTIAYRRSTNALNNYDPVSDRNLFYAGTPGTANLIMYDGTNSYQTIALYKAAVTPRDQASVTHNPTFLSTSGASANFLHIDPAVPTPIESGGAPVTGITDDYDAQARNATTPDMGADEFTGINLDVIPPAITYAALGNTCGLGNRTLTGVTITDLSGIPLTGTFIPRIYWKVNAGSYVSAAGVNTGGTATNSTWDFTMTGPFAVGNVISYFIIAQDLTGNTTGNPSAGLVATDVNTVTTPPTTPNTFAIGSTFSGTYTVGAGQVSPNFVTLTDAINAYNIGCPSGPIIYELTDALYGPSETFPLTILANAGASAVNTLTIRPQTGMVGIQVTSSNAVGTLDMNGAKYATIDGRPGGTGTAQQLSVINTAATGSAVRMYNDASNNKLTYLDLQGQNTNTTTNTTTNSGVVYIGGTSTTAQTGNDNNTISFSNIHAVNATTATPSIGISSIGTVTTPTSYNDTLTINNCNIYDFFNAGAASTGIKMDVGNSAGSITNNSVYQTATRIYTTAAITHRGFWITPNTGSLTPQASGFTITGNYIGGTAPLAGGTAYTMQGAVTYMFNGMDISVGLGIPSSIQGNTITNYDMNTANTGSTSMVGINIANGHVNCGTITGNVIGSTTATPGILFTATANTGGVIGIRTGAGGTLNISNNIVAGITLNASTTATTPIFNGIAASGGTTINITNNTIGSATVPNSINLPGASVSTSAQSVRGIIVNGGTTSTVTGNLVANMTSNNLAAGTQTTSMVGILVSSTTSTITGNTIRDLSSASQTTNAGVNAPVLGIGYSAALAPLTVSGNIIHSLTSTAASGSVNVVGMFISAAATGTNTIAKNFIHTLNASSAGAAATITGLDLGAGQVNVTNNMFRLGVDAAGAGITSPTVFRGISQGGTLTASNFYYNSIYIGGTGTGTTNTFAFHKNGTLASGTENVKNNIFANVRSGGGKHYAVYLLTNATGVSLSNNVYYTPGLNGTMGFNGTADVTTYTNGWAAGDINSYVGDPQFINPTGSSSTLDLHISTATPSPAESGATPVALVTDDFDGNARSATLPDIGADEFSGTTPTPVLTNVTRTPTNPQCVATARTISVTISSLGGPITSVTLDYNNGAAGSTAMTLSSGTTTNGVWTGIIPAASPASSVVTWSITASNGFATTYIGSSYQDAYLTGSTTTATATPAAVCTGNTSSLAVLTVVGGPGTVTIGTPTTTIGGSNGNPYRSGNGAGNQIRIQLLYTAAELAAQGLAAGPITSIGLTTTSASSGTVVNFSIDMKHTSQTTTTTNFDNTGFTTVFTQASFTPLAAGLNTHVFSTPFVWDGVSNILINFCQTNSISGTATVNAYTPATPSNLNSSGTTTGCTAATGTIVAGKPVVTFSGVVGINYSSTMAWTWNPGAITGNPATTPALVAPATYTATGVDANGCTVTSNPVTISINPPPSAPGATNSTQCGYGIPTASVASTAGVNGSGTFKWYAAATGGTALQSGTGTTYASPVNATTTFYVSEVGTNTCESPRTPVTVTVNQPDAVTASTTTPIACLGSALSLLATQAGTSNTYTYTWSAAPTAGSGMATPLTGAAQSITPTATGTYVYTVLANDAGLNCNAISTVTVTVNYQPAAPVVTPSSATICQGTIQTLSTGTGSPLYNFGTQAAVNGLLNDATDFPAPYTVWWGGQRMQMLIKASELSAAGFVAGSQVTNIQFPVVSMGANWGTTITALQNFQVSIGNTALTSLATFQTGLTQVIAPSSFTPTVGYNNTHTFTTPFMWDGTSNLIFESTFSNNIAGGTGDVVVQYNSPTTYPATIIYRADNVTAAAAASSTTVNYVYNARPDFKLNGSNPSISWTPTTGLYTDGSATIAYTGGASSTVYAKPLTTTTYTATAGAGCTNTSTATITVSQPVAITTQPPATQGLCAGTALTLSVVASNGSGYQWYKGATALVNGGNISGATTASLSIANTAAGDAGSYTVQITGTAPCADVTSTATAVTINPVIAGNAITAPQSICSGATPAALTGSTPTGGDGSYTYIWQSSTTSGTSGFTAATGANAASGYAPGALTANTWYRRVVISGGCSDTSLAVQITITAPPSGVTAASSAASVCSGGTINLTSGPATTAIPLYSENFNGATNSWTTANNSTGGTVAASAWTLRTSPYAASWGQTLTAPATSQFYLSNSDAQGSAGTTNTVLQSPAINTVGITSLNLTFSHFYKLYLTTETAAVEVSTNGTTWTAVQNYATGLAANGEIGTPSSFASATLNLNSYVGNPTLYIRFRYNAAWGYGWAIDNVGLSSNFNNTFAWTSTPTGFTSTTQNPTNVAPTTNTTYTVTVTGPGGCTATANASVVVNPLPSGVTAASSAATICSGGTINLTSAPATTAVPLYSEDFNGATNSWTTANNSTGGTVAASAWTLRTSPYAASWGQTLTAPATSQFYLSNSDAQGSAGTTNTVLQSPAINTVGITSLNLTFSHFYKLYLTTETAAVEVSTNGTTWTAVQNYATGLAANGEIGTPSSFASATLNLNAYVGNPTLYIRFRYNAAWGYGWAIDNVALSSSFNNTFAWTSAPAGFTSAVQNPTSVAPTANTTYTVTVTGPGGCTATANTSVAVNQPIATNTVSAAQTICSGSTPAALTGTTPTGGNGGPYTYLWESSTTSATTGFATATGTSNGSGYTPGALTATTWYRRTVTGGVCANNVSTAIQITVDPAITNNTVSAAQTICSGSTPTALTGTTPAGGNGGPYTYLWESSTTSATTGFTTATGTSNGSGYTPGALTATTWYRRTVSGGVCANNVSTAIQITVDQAITSNTVSAAQTICSGSTPAALTGTTPTGGNGGPYTYLWESSTTSATTGFTTATGTSNGSGYTPGALTATTWYRRTVSGGACAANVSPAIQITITAAPAFTTQPAATATVCEGGNITLTVAANNAVTYAWRKGGIALSNGSGISGVSTNTLVINNATPTTNGSYDVVITGGTGCSTVTSTASTVTVTPTAGSLPPNGSTATITQPDGTTNIYSSATCQPIAKITDAAGGTALGSVTATVNLTATVQNAPNGQKYLQRSYVINPTTNGPATVTLYALQSEFTAYNAATGVYPLMPITGSNTDPNIPNVRVTKYVGTPFTGGTNAALLTPTSVVWNATNSYWEITVSIGSFSSFYIHTGTQGPLDIELRSISATNVGSRNRVDWVTENEADADRFELERGTDGINYTFLGTVKAKGQSSTYSYWDENPVNGLNHYRLKMFNKSGSFTYSRDVTAFVKSKGAFIVEAYPNPVSDQLTVRVNGTIGDHATIVLTDVTGKLIQQIEVKGSVTTVDMNNVAQGMYLVKYIDDDHAQTIKVNKQ
jgi:hypothetical protein